MKMNKNAQQAKAQTINTDTLAEVLWRVQSAVRKAQRDAAVTKIRKACSEDLSACQEGRTIP